MTHELKCKPDFWRDYKSGIKTGSMRKNDRHFSVGDLCVLRLWEDERFITGEIAVRKITHIVHDFDFKELPKGYCLLSFKEV